MWVKENYIEELESFNTNRFCEDSLGPRFSDKTIYQSRSKISFNEE